MEGLLEILVELYTDTFYEVRGEYLEKLELIRQEGDFGSFRDITELKRAIGAEGYDHTAKFFW